MRPRPAGKRTIRTFCAAAMALGAAGAAIAEEKASSGWSAAPYFVEVKPLSAPIIDGPRYTGTLNVKLTVEAPTISMAADLTTKAPWLREQLYSALSDFTRLHASRFEPVDAEQLATLLDARLQEHAPGVKVRLVEVSARIK